MLLKEKCDRQMEGQSAERTERQKDELPDRPHQLYILSLHRWHGIMNQKNLDFKEQPTEFWKQTKSISLFQ